MKSITSITVLVLLSFTLSSCYETTYFTIEELLILYKQSPDKQERYLLDQNFIFDRYEGVTKTFVRRFSDGFLAKITTTKTYEPNDWSGVREVVSIDTAGTVNYISRDQKEYFRSKSAFSQLGLELSTSKSDSNPTAKLYFADDYFVIASVQNDYRENMNYNFIIMTMKQSKLQSERPTGSNQVKETPITLSGKWGRSGGMRYNGTYVFSSDGSFSFSSQRGTLQGVYKIKGQIIIFNYDAGDRFDGLSSATEVYTIQNGSLNDGLLEGSMDSSIGPETIRLSKLD